MSDEELDMIDETLDTVEDKANSGFIVTFSDAYAFRCLMDFIGATIVNVPLVISTSGLSIERADSNITIFHRTIFDYRKMIEFYVHPKFQDSEIVVGVQMRLFKTKIKNANKRGNQLTLFNNLTERDRFYAKFTSSAQKSSGGSYFIPILNMKDADQEYTIPDYEPDSLANLTVQVGDANQKFKDTTTSKCQFTRIDCYRRGLLIWPIVDNEPISVQLLGKVLDPTMYKEKAIKYNGEVIVSYTVPACNIKPFSKLSNIATASSTLQIYYAPDKPLKFVFPVGSAGEHAVYLTSVDMDTMKPDKGKKGKRR